MMIKTLEYKNGILHLLDADAASGSNEIYRN